MTKLKKFSICLVSGMVLLGTVSFARTGTVNAPNGLVLRETASKEANPIITVSDEETVEILEENGEWYKVKYGNYEGYMFAEYVEAEEVVEEAPAEENTETEEQAPETVVDESQETAQKYPQDVVLKSNVKIYLIPSITSKVIANAEASKEITVNYELNDWVNVTYNNIQGWVRKYYINLEVTNEQENTNTETTTPEENTTESEEQNNTVTVENKKGYIDVSVSANIRETASTSANIITTLTRNTGVTIIGEEGEFYKIKYQDITGYVAKSLVSDNPVEVTSRSSEVRKVESQEEQKQETIQNEQANTTVANSVSGQNVVAFAKKYLGYSYVYGGTTPSTGFDCTGFTYYVYNSCGYSLSRICSEQASTGTAVSKENLQAGDLLLFNNGSNGSIGHVGIYIGGGNFIHAANSRRGVTTDTINSGYYDTYYYSARRIVE